MMTKSALAKLKKLASFNQCSICGAQRWSRPDYLRDECRVCFPNAGPWGKQRWATSLQEAIRFALAKIDELEALKSSVLPIPGECDCVPGSSVLCWPCDRLKAFAEGRWRGETILCRSCGGAYPDINAELVTGNRDLVTRVRAWADWHRESLESSLDELKEIIEVES